SVSEDLRSRDLVRDAELVDGVVVRIRDVREACRRVDGLAVEVEQVPTPKHSAMPLRKLWLGEERTVVEGGATTARRVLEPSADELGPRDCVQHLRKLALRHLTEPLDREVIGWRGFEQETDLVQAESGTLRGIDDAERTQDVGRVAPPPAHTVGGRKEAD